MSHSKNANPAAVDPKMISANGLYRKNLVYEFTHEHYGPLDTQFSHKPRPVEKMLMMSQPVVEYKDKDGTMKPNPTIPQLITIGIINPKQAGLKDRAIWRRK